MAYRYSDANVTTEGQPILGFHDGVHDFMSNFADAPVTLERIFADDPRYKGVVFRSTEVAYQAAKAAPDFLFREDPDLLGPRAREIDRILAMTSAQAKRYGGDIGRDRAGRTDREWLMAVMEDILDQKFSQPGMRAKLLATGNRPIVEANHWHDNFWGVCSCQNCGGNGRNELGKMLERKRAKEQRRERGEPVEDRPAVAVGAPTRPRAMGQAASANAGRGSDWFLAQPAQPARAGNTDRFLAGGQSGVDKTLAAGTMGTASDRRPEPARRTAPAPKHDENAAVKAAAFDPNGRAVVAIIGTAGRKDDAAKLDVKTYAAMMRDAETRVARYPEASLVSGGAAWADHIAVRLFLAGKAKGLTLHLPAPFENGRFREGADKFDPGKTANYYHRRMRESTGIDGLKDIETAIAKGAVATVGDGFKARNSVVAREANVVLAYTFGAGREVSESTSGEAAHRDALAAGLKDGGTADTWNKAQGAAVKIHVPIDLLRERGALAAEAPAPASQVKPAAETGRTPAIRASMYFNYGAHRRPGVQSGSTFEAILAGERTSTTRFPSWPGYDRWKRVQPGEVVRFYADKEMHGAWVDVVIKGTQIVDLAKAPAEAVETWSRKEGWSIEHGRDICRQRGPGLQIEYAPLVLENGEISRGGGAPRTKDRAATR